MLGPLQILGAQDRHAALPPAPRAQTYRRVAYAIVADRARSSSMPMLDPLLPLESSAYALIFCISASDTSKLA